jgi:hypothetical protein
MKMYGSAVEGPHVEVVVIPRHPRNLVFKAQAVLDEEDFEKLCPKPEPPTKMFPGGKTIKDVEDPGFRESLSTWASKKTDWLVLKSLQATPGLEWEKTNISDAATWPLYKEELREAGLSAAEIARIVRCVIDACGMNDDKIEQATKDFLAGQGANQEEESSQDIEAKSTLSIESAKD